MNILIKQQSLESQEKIIEELNKKSQIVEAWFHNMNLLLEYLLDENSTTFNPQKALRIIKIRDSHQYMMLTNWLNDNSDNEIKKRVKDCYDIEQEKEFLKSNIGKFITPLNK